jgi:hypothetical protein
MVATKHGLQVFNHLRMIAQQAGGMTDIAADRLDEQKQGRDLLHRLVNQRTRLGIPGNRHLAALGSDFGCRTVVSNVKRDRLVELDMGAIAGLCSPDREIEHELAFATR